VAADIIAVKAVVDTIVGRVIGTIATGTHNPQSGDAFARLGAPAGASIAADINAIPTAAENADAIWDEDVDTTHQTAGTAGKKLDDAGGAADPWSTALPGAYGAGTAGKIIGDNVNAPIATVDTVVDAIKAKTDNLPADPADQSAVEAAITAAHSTTNAYIDTEVAAVLADTNELQTDLANGGRLDLLIDAIKAKTDGLPSDPADESLLEAAIAAIQADTDDIQTRLPATLSTGRMRAHVEAQDNIDFGALQKASLNAATPASVVGAVGSVAGAVGSVTGNVGGNVTGSVGSLATQAKADVNAEIVDALNVDTYAEPGQEAPAATVSLVKKIGYLFKAWRNKKSNNGTENQLYADDATTVDQKASTTEATGTVTEGEWGTGP
jgi:hypothetical protein